MNKPNHISETLKAYSESKKVPQRSEKDLSPLESFLLDELYSYRKEDEKLARGTWKLTVSKSHVKGEENYFNFDLADNRQRFTKKFPQTDCRHIMQIIDNAI